jgi:hypothetical protein
MRRGQFRASAWISDGIGIVGFGLASSCTQESGAETVGSSDTVRFKLHHPPAYPSDWSVCDLGIIAYLQER